MPIIRRDGYSGKICEVCKCWKILAEFPLDAKSKKFKGLRLNICKQCQKSQKQ